MSANLAAVETVEECEESPLPMSTSRTPGLSATSPLELPNRLSEMLYTVTSELRDRLNAISSRTPPEDSSEGSP